METGSVAHDLAQELTAAFTLGLPHVAVILACVAMLTRTASALQRSRFLYHLAGVYAVMGVYYLGSMAVAGVRHQLYVPTDQSTVDLVEQIGLSWEAANLVLSYLSTLWLMLVWYLIRHYPDEGVGQRFYVLLLGAAPIAIGGVIGVVKLVGANPLYVMQVLDPVASLVGCGLVGFEMNRFARRKIERRPTLAFCLGLFAFGSYVGWGLVQLPYFFRVLGWLNPDDPVYGILLIVTKLMAAIAAVVLGAVALEEQPRFKSEPGRQI